MQDRYVADVGDFGKYGLLRCLTGVTCGSKKDALKLGVIWYLTPSSHGNEGDGKHLSYLDQSDEFRRFDEKLFDDLEGIANKIAPPDRRGVRGRAQNYMRVMEADFKAKKKCALNLIENEQAKILGDAKYYNIPLQKMRNRDNARDARNVWWANCREDIKEHKLIFMDPDNGLRVKYPDDGVAFVSRDSEKTSIKHAYIEEVSEVINKWRSSLVLYHHLGRCGGTHDEQIRKIAEELKKAVPEIGSVIAYRFRRGSSRAFFILARQEHCEILKRPICHFESRWVTDEGPFEKCIES